MREITIRIRERTLRIFAVGIVGALVLCASFYLWHSGIFVPKYRLSVYVPEIAGLAAGSPVVLDGIPVGRVETVRLSEASASPERRIELVLQIERRFQDDIRTDSTAGVTTEGLLGRPFVRIQRGFNGRLIGAGGEIKFILTPEMKVNDYLALLARLADCQSQSKQATDRTSR